MSCLFASLALATIKAFFPSALSAEVTSGQTVIEPNSTPPRKLGHREKWPSKLFLVINLLASAHSDVPLRLSSGHVVAMTRGHDPVTTRPQ